MRKLAITIAAVSGLALTGCTTGQGALVGGATGAAVVGLAGGSLGAAIVGAGIGAAAGAILVQSTGNTCYYKYKGKYYKD
ncbi:MAG: hypothetical protein RLO48_11570, partial [Bauldia litoralis]